MSMPPPQVAPSQSAQGGPPAGSPYNHQAPVMGGIRPNANLMGTPNMSTPGNQNGAMGYNAPSGSNANPPHGNGIATTNATYSGINHGNSSSSSSGSGGGGSGGVGGNGSLSNHNLALGNGAGATGHSQHHQHQHHVPSALAGPSSSAGPAASAPSHGPSAATAGAAASIGALFPPGAAVLRMMQMYDAMSGKGTLNEANMLNLDYWRSLVHEFFVPDGCYRNIVWNPQAREQRAFELPVAVLARYLHTVALSGAVSRSVALCQSREFGPHTLRSIPPPPQTKRAIAGMPNARTTHFVQVDRTKMTLEYENGWVVVHTGLLRAGLTPYAGGLKFQFIDFHVSHHESFFPRARIVRHVVDQVISEDLVSKIRGAASKRETKKEKKEREEREQRGEDGSGGGGNGGNGGKGGAEDDKHSKGFSGDSGDRFTVPIERVTIPEIPVNEYGLTLRAMRCFEITESVCQLRDLMDYAAQHDLGPMNALHRLAEEFRAAQSRSSNQQGHSSGEGSGDSYGNLETSPSSTDKGGLSLKRRQGPKVEGGGGGGGGGDDDAGLKSPNKRMR